MKMEVLPGQLLLLFVERMTLCFLEGSELIFYLVERKRKGKGQMGQEVYFIEFHIRRCCE